MKLLLPSTIFSDIHGFRIFKMGTYAVGRKSSTTRKAYWKKDFERWTIPFDLPLEEFIFMFRVSPELVFDVINTIRPLLQGQRSSGLSVEVQVS